MTEWLTDLVDRRDGWNVPSPAECELSKQRVYRTEWERGLFPVIPVQIPAFPSRLFPAEGSRNILDIQEVADALVRDEVAFLFRG